MLAVVGSPATWEVVALTESIRLQVDTAADRVGVIELVGAVALQPVGRILLVGVLGDAVVEQVADRIGLKVRLE